MNETSPPGPLSEGGAGDLSNFNSPANNGNAAMKIDFKTDSGKKRDHNEDSIIVDGKNGIILLADGMGGRQSGEVASRMAVEVAYEHLFYAIEENVAESDIFRILKEAFVKAHDAIKICSQNVIDLTGMGTTLILAIVKCDVAYICHAGDSRVYLTRRNMKQITKDHTVANYLAEHDKMRSEEIPEKLHHTLTQAVGVTDKIHPDINTVPLKTGDVLLFCSDGLTDMLNDKEIEKIIKKYRKKEFDKTAAALVEAANEKGGKDNISVVLVKQGTAETELECVFFRL